MDKIILLIEDNPDDRVLTLRALLKDLQDGTVIVCYEVEALDFLFGTGDYSGRDLSARPHLILLGLTLSHVSSLEVLRCIKGDTRTQDIPVVVLTSSNKGQDILNSYNLGANSYVRKQLDYCLFCDDMKRTTAYWLDLNQVPQGHTVTGGDIPLVSATKSKVYSKSLDSIGKRPWLKCARLNWLDSGCRTRLEKD